MISIVAQLVFKKGEPFYHKIEASHEQNEVSQKNPVSLQSDFSFLNESLSDIRAIFANFLAFKEGLGFGKAETERNNEDWRTCAEPEQLDSVSIQVFKYTRKTEHTGRHPWLVVFTKPLANAVASKYPNA
jgi:hypothetical protein